MFDLTQVLFDPLIFHFSQIFPKIFTSNKKYSVCSFSPLLPSSLAFNKDPKVFDRQCQFLFFCGTISRGSHRYITLLICCANFVKLVMAYPLVFTVRAVDNLYCCPT